MRDVVRVDCVLEPLEEGLGPIRLNLNGSCWLSGGRCHHCPYQGRCDPFQIVAAFKHRTIASEKPFTQATKQTQEIAAARPNALHRVVMDFANAITVIITRPLATVGCMANRLVTTASGGAVLRGRPFISVDDRVGARMGEHEGFQCGPISPFPNPAADLTTAAPDNTGNWGTIAGPRPVATRLIGPAPRWVERVSVFAALLTGILIAFVGFGHWVGQGCGRGKNAPPPACVSGVVVRAGGCD